MRSSWPGPTGSMTSGARLPCGPSRSGTGAAGFGGSGVGEGEETGRSPEGAFEKAGRRKGADPQRGSGADKDERYNIYIVVGSAFLFGHPLHEVGGQGLIRRAAVGWEDILGLVVSLSLLYYLMRAMLKAERI